MRETGVCDAGQTGKRPQYEEKSSTNLVLCFCVHVGEKGRYPFGRFRRIGVRIPSVQHITRETMNRRIGDSAASLEMRVSDEARCFKTRKNQYLG